VVSVNKRGELAMLIYDYTRLMRQEQLTNAELQVTVNRRTIVEHDLPMSNEIPTVQSSVPIKSD